MAGTKNSILAETSQGTISGYCDPQFSSLLDVFRENFEQRDELGASFCLRLEGETVVDLWGGRFLPDDDKPWEQDTMCIVWSSTKGATALCAHILASRGQLDLDAPVARYWPEFAQNGKENITVRMIMDHSSGVSGFTDKLPDGAFLDWDLIISTLEKQEPYWEPGTRQGYHAFTIGWLVGEVVRRITGKSLGTFFREEVGDPLDLEFWIGLPEELEGRISPVIMPPPPPADQVNPMVRDAVRDPKSITSRSVFNSGRWEAKYLQKREGHAAEIPGAGGIANARGLAGMYAPLACGGSLDGVTLVDQDSLVRMGATSMATWRDASLHFPTRFALGYMKSTDNRRMGQGQTSSMLLSESAFGHPGFGGSLGFADPRARLSFGYAMNRMGQGMLTSDRGEALIDATYAALGYSSRESGYWVK